MDIAHGSLERTGLFVLGETHGIAETANTILTLVRALGIRSLGLEWSFDEVGELVDEAVATGRFDLDALWQVPTGGDLFAGDGRLTAGHVRMLELLIQSGELTRVIPFDRLDRDPPLEIDREAEMSRRLLEHLGPEAPMLAVTGFFHAAREPFEGLEPMFVHLERTLPSLANGVLDFSLGTAYSRGEQPLTPVGSKVDAIFRLGRASPATVPVRHA